MHFKAILEMSDYKHRYIGDRVIAVRKEEIADVINIVHKIRGAKWNCIVPISQKEYIDIVSKQH